MYLSYKLSFAHIKNFLAVFFWSFTLKQEFVDCAGVNLRDIWVNFHIGGAKNSSKIKFLYILVSLENCAEDRVGMVCRSVTKHSFSDP